ncbi:ABC transporter permease [Pseudoroseicyclus sp. CXY001]|uniref:ABC transporter permease n=1 Tax=Pseudoroseicyclus sp. CXY001 TaxID=3242492 RepID=UPI003571489C
MSLLHSEWTKLRSLRTTWILALSAVGSGVALSLLGVSDMLGSAPADLPADWDPTAESLKGFLFAQLLIGMLGALVFTSEFDTGTIAPSLSIAPSRGRLLAAKTGVVLAIAFVTSLVTTAFSFAAVQLTLQGAGLPSALADGSNVLVALAGAIGYLTLVCLLGVAVGGILKSATGSLGALVGITLLVPAIAPGLPGAIGEAFARYWPINAGQAAYATLPSAEAVAPGLGLGILAACAALALGACHLLFRARDI